MVLLNGWSGSGDEEATPELSTGTSFSSAGVLRLSNR